MKNLDDNLTVLAQLGDLLGCAHHASVTLDHIIGAPTNLTPARRHVTDLTDAHRAVGTLAAALRRAITDLETQALR
jgi:hypothetical protein